MLWLTVLLACFEAPPPAPPSTPSIATRAPFNAPVDSRLPSADIKPEAQVPPAAVEPVVPKTLEETVGMSPEQRARLRQALCGADAAVLRSVSDTWRETEVDGRFLIQPWADLVQDCASPRLCAWASKQPAGRPLDLGHAVGARCPANPEDPWWLDPEAPSLAVIRHYQPPNAGTDRWRVPYHVRWKRALSERIALLGPQAGSDPDILTGLQRLATHPDPAANEAARALHESLPVGARLPLPPSPPTIDYIGCSRTLDDLPARLRGTAEGKAMLERCWLTTLRETRMLAAGEALRLVDRDLHGSDLILHDAQTLGGFLTASQLADPLRGAGIITSSTVVPPGTAWASPRHLLDHLGYTETLPTEVSGWPRGFDRLLGRLVSLPGSTIADTRFLEEEDGVIQAFADGFQWEVVSLDSGGKVDQDALVGFLNTIARDRGHQTRFLLLDNNEVIAAPTRGIEEAAKHDWFPVPEPLPASSAN